MTEGAMLQAVLQKFDIVLNLFRYPEAHATRCPVWTIIDWMLTITLHSKYSEFHWKSQKTVQSMTVLPQISIRDTKIHFILVIISIAETHAIWCPLWNAYPYNYTQNTQSYNQSLKPVQSMIVLPQISFRDPKIYFIPVIIPIA